MIDMAEAETVSTPAKWFGRASIGSSLLLFAAAALQLDVTFWVLVCTNFVLMHAVWLTQFARHGSWEAIDFRAVKWPLVSFAALGNAALLLWGDQLLAVFPA